MAEFTMTEALRCDPLPHDIPHPFDITTPVKTREASDVIWASISNSAAWPVAHDFEDALAVGRNVIEALYRAGFTVATPENNGRGGDDG